MNSVILLSALCSTAIGAALVLRRIGNIIKKQPRTIVQLQCKCEKVKLVAKVKPQGQTNCKCSCSDCRDFATIMEKRQNKEGMNYKYFNKQGTCKLALVSGYFAAITEGNEYLKLSKLTKGSDLVRVYASCCNTPMFSILGGGMANYFPLLSFDLSNIHEIAGNHNEDTSFGKFWVYTFASEALKPLDTSLPKDEAVFVDGVPPLSVLVHFLKPLFTSLLLGRGEFPRVCDFKNYDTIEILNEQ